MESILKLYSEDCSICLSLIEEPFFFPCGHTTCKNCALELFNSCAHNECPLCRKVCFYHPLKPLPNSMEVGINILK